MVQGNEVNDESLTAPADDAVAPKVSKKRDRDRFEKPPKMRRVGVHRIAGRQNKFWVYLVSALLGIIVLTGAGVFAVIYTGADITKWMEEEPEPEPVPEPVIPAIDPAAEVLVLNATGMPNFGAIVDPLITKNEWGKILFSGDAVEIVTETIVFYASVTDEANAMGLAEQLGGVDVYQSYDYAAYGARLIVLIGQDYTGPGSDKLVLPDPPPATDPEASSETETPAAE